MREKNILEDVKLSGENDYIVLPKEVNMRKEKLYFWYSGKQKKLWNSLLFLKYDRRFALIKGKKVEYTECTKKRQASGVWDDYKYLGRGIIYSIRGIIQ